MLLWPTKGFSPFAQSSTALPTLEVMCDGLHLKTSKSPRTVNQALPSCHPTSILSVALCCRSVSEYWRCTNVMTILLQVLTGKVPFSECRSDHQVTVKILRGNKPARPTLHIEDCLWDFILTCWLEAERRPSAKDALDFIQNQLKLEGKS